MDSTTNDVVLAVGVVIESGIIYISLIDTEGKLMAEEASNIPEEILSALSSADETWCGMTWPERPYESAKRLARFIRAKIDLRKRYLLSAEGGHMTVVVERAPEYGELFTKDHSNMLMQYSVPRHTVPVTVLPFDATSYLGCFDGIVLRADNGVSAAMNGTNKPIYIDERGHLIGDPGSAYWISNKCLRMIYDNDDGIEPVSFDMERVKKAANEYFSLTTPLDILKPLYTNFCRQNVSSFSVANDGDEFCIYLFNEAGKKLGILCKALLAKGKNENELAPRSTGDLEILTGGRVWEFYPLIRNGFLEVMKRMDSDVAAGDQTRYLKIYKWTSSNSHAAALLGLALSTYKKIIFPRDNVQLVSTEVIG